MPNGSKTAVSDRCLRLSVVAVRPMRSSSHHSLISGFRLDRRPHFRYSKMHQIWVTSVLAAMHPELAPHSTSNGAPSGSISRSLPHGTNCVMQEKRKSINLSRSDLVSCVVKATPRPYGPLYLHAFRNG